MRSIDAPMIAMSRAARSSMRSTARASQVGLSHSTQPRKPCSMASESKGRLAGFILLSLGLLEFGARSFALRRYENDPRRICKVKHAARRAGLAQPKTGLTRHALGASLN